MDAESREDRIHDCLVEVNLFDAIGWKKARQVSDEGLVVNRLENDGIIDVNLNVINERTHKRHGEMLGIFDVIHPMSC